MAHFKPFFPTVNAGKIMQDIMKELGKVDKKIRFCVDQEEMKILLELRDDLFEEREFVSTYFIY